MISITLNGETRRVPPESNLEAVLESLGLDPARLAVERNGEIVRRGSYGEVRVEEGDRYEVVRIVGGG